MKTTLAVLSVLFMLTAMTQTSSLSNQVEQISAKKKFPSDDQGDGDDDLQLKVDKTLV